MKPNIINPFANATNRSWFFEQQVYDPNGIIRAIKSTDGSGNVPKVIIYEPMEDVFSCAFRGRSDGDWFLSQHQQRLEIGTDISNSITRVLKDSLVLMVYETDKD